LTDGLCGLLLDFGGVLLATPFERLDHLERRVGLPAGTLAWRGPFAPAADPLWAELQAGRVDERDYWRRRAAEVGRLLGREWTLRDLVAEVFTGPGLGVRPEAEALVGDARAAGLATAILSNDLELFHGRAWMDRVGLLGRVDALVDGSVTGVRKPDPASYRLALDALGLDPAAVLFVDDQPANLAGATRAGLATEPFDVTDPPGSFHRVRRRLGL